LWLLVEVVVVATKTMAKVAVELVD